MDEKKVIVYGPLIELPEGDEQERGVELLQGIANLVAKVRGVQVPPVRSLYDDTFPWAGLGGAFRDQLGEASLLIIYSFDVSVETAAVVTMAEQYGLPVLVIFPKKEDIFWALLKHPWVDGRYLVLREDGEDWALVISAVQKALAEDLPAEQTDVKRVDVEEANEEE